MNTQLVRRFKSFLSEINGKNRVGLTPSLVEEDFRSIPLPMKTDVVPYFGLQTLPNESLKINISEKTIGSNCLLSVNYSKRDEQLFPTLCKLTSLPESVLAIIADYIYCEIRLLFNIAFPERYPFNPPIWSIVSSEIKFSHNSNEYGGMNLHDYYAYLVEMHNNHYHYRDNWTPSYSINQDVLLFINRINHFNSI